MHGAHVMQRRKQRAPVTPDRPAGTDLHRHCRRGDGGVHGEFKWSSQHHGEEVAMRSGRRQSDRALRPVLKRSPGRPGVAQRENRRRFWAAIALGRSSEAAGLEVGVSQAVGARWFREAGGMPPKILAPSSKPPSERYLSFAEREE